MKFYHIVFKRFSRLDIFKIQEMQQVFATQRKKRAPPEIIFPEPNRYYRGEVVEPDGIEPTTS
jgi:hypothetical protein